MISFTTQLFTSKRAYINEIEPDTFVFYSPDNKGLPFIGHKKVKEVFERYDSGSSVLDALVQDNTDEQSASLQITKYLFDKGLLKETSTPMRYSALEFPKPEKVKSLSSWFHINNGCNLGCDYCFVNKG